MPEVHILNWACWDSWLANILEKLVQVSQLSQDIKVAIVAATVALREVEDRIQVVEDWERGMRTQLQDGGK